ncbi:hypothetical protein ACGF7U_27180 [Micromonospora sp. NPDC047670]|uniref:hypothetical protein n=1 Tax=Micromonospora sp. NPDC047670 TaxID=3364252 RepID=UPI0037120F37
MTQRVVVDDVGIRTEDDRHAFCWPWSEIQHVSVAVLPLPKHRHLYFEVTHVSGEFTELGEAVDGFREAVRDIAARAGRPAPDLDALRPTDAVLEIWPSPEAGG